MAASSSLPLGSSRKLQACLRFFNVDQAKNKKWLILVITPIIGIPQFSDVEQYVQAGCH